MAKLTKEEKRKNALLAAARRAGCKVRVDEKQVYVFVPGYDIGVGIKMPSEIDAFIATGKPSATAIIAAAKQQAEETDYYPAWNYILNDPEFYVRGSSKHRKGRKRA